MSIRDTTYTSKNTFSTAKFMDRDRLATSEFGKVDEQRVHKQKIYISRRSDSKDTGYFSGLISKLMSTSSKQDEDSTDEDPNNEKRRNALSIVGTADCTPFASDIETPLSKLMKKASNISDNSTFRGSTASDVQALTTSSKEENVMFVPCMNCGNHINIDDIGNNNK